MLPHISDNTLTYFLGQDINLIQLFSIITDTSHPIYLVIHQMVPQEIVDTIQRYVSKFNLFL